MGSVGTSPRHLQRAEVDARLAHESVDTVAHTYIYISNSSCTALLQGVPKVSPRLSLLFRSLSSPLRSMGGGIQDAGDPEEPPIVAVDPRGTQIDAVGDGECFACALDAVLCSCAAFCFRSLAIAAAFSCNCSLHLQQQASLNT